MYIRFSADHSFYFINLLKTIPDTPKYSYFSAELYDHTCNLLYVIHALYIYFCYSLSAVACLIIFCVSDWMTNLNRTKANSV